MLCYFMLKETNLHCFYFISLIIQLNQILTANMIVIVIAAHCVKR